MQRRTWKKIFFYLTRIFFHFNKLFQEKREIPLLLLFKASLDRALVEQVLVRMESSAWKLELSKLFHGCFCTFWSKCLFESPFLLSMCYLANLQEPALFMSSPVTLPYPHYTGRHKHHRKCFLACILKKWKCEKQVSGTMTVTANT